MACPTPNDVQAMSITESVLIPLRRRQPDRSFRSRVRGALGRRIKAFNTHRHTWCSFGVCQRRLRDRIDRVLHNVYTEHSLVPIGRVHVVLVDLSETPLRVCIHVIHVVGHNDDCKPF